MHFCCIWLFADQWEGFIGWCVGVVCGCGMWVVCVWGGVCVCVCGGGVGEGVCLGVCVQGCVEVGVRCVCACLQKEFLTECLLMVSQVWWSGVWVKLIVSLAIFVSYMFCYFDCFGILNCKIVVIQLLVYAAMTVFNKPLMKWMKWNGHGRSIYDPTICSVLIFCFVLFCFLFCFFLLVR